MTEINLIISADSKIPIYKQIEEYLLEYIQKSPAGTKLPSYTEISGQFNIAVNTVRQAYNRLQNKGLIIQKAGRGTFINSTSAADKKVSIFFNVGTPRDYFYDILAGISKGLNKYNIAAYSNFEYSDENQEKRILLSFFASGIRDFIILPKNQLWGFYADLTGKGANIVFVNDYPRHKKSFSYVSTDDFTACFNTGEAICKKKTPPYILLFSDLVPHAPFENRLNGYIRAFHEARLRENIDYFIIRYKAFDMNDFNRQMNENTGRIKMASVIFCHSDYAAINAINFLRRQKKIAVPDKIGVVGYADLLIGNFFDPPLTTIRQNGFAVGETGVEMLLKTTKKKQILLPCELVIRESCII